LERRDRDVPETWSALLHLLVFAYWLGGDAGAFTASLTLSDSRQSPAARLTAAKILNQVDMAPRSALILTLPTGLTLAVQRGWIALSPEALILAWIVGLMWLAALWAAHASHAPSQTWRVIDLCLRTILIFGAAVAAVIVEPLFLKIKFVCLALATLLGLAIRRAVAPMAPAIAQLARGENMAVTDRTIIRALSIARPLVVCIWGCLLIAAWAAIAKPG
jgi:hypothetical protein